MARIIDAFLERRNWRQAELAQHVGIGVQALRKHLLELSSNLRLSSKEDHPDVYWERPSKWHPAGAVIGGQDVATLVRLLARTPISAGRDRLLRLLLHLDPRLSAPSRIRARDLSTELFLPLVEDAATRQRPLRMNYLSARRGDADWRVVSVARVLPGPPSRFLAVCHRSGELHTFRVGDVKAAYLDANELFRDVDAAIVERRLLESVDGWHSDRAGEIAFTVHGAATRWVSRNLLDGMRSETLSDGSLRATASAAGLATVARFVVGLGDAAVCETPELQTSVRNLALGALGASGAKALDKRSVTRIRAKG